MTITNDCETGGLPGHEPIRPQCCGVKPGLAPVPSKAIALLAVMMLRLTASAQTWQTVDDFQYSPGVAAENFGLTVAPSGIVYACGWAGDGMTRHGLVMASADSGNTWSAPEPIMESKNSRRYESYKPSSQYRT